MHWIHWSYYLMALGSLTIITMASSVSFEMSESVSVYKRGSDSRSGGIKSSGRHKLNVPQSKFASAASAGTSDSDGESFSASPRDGGRQGSSPIFKFEMTEREFPHFLLDSSSDDDDTRGVKHARKRSGDREPRRTKRHDTTNDKLRKKKRSKSSPGHHNRGRRTITTTTPPQFIPDTGSRLRRNRSIAEKMDHANRWNTAMQRWGNLHRNGGGKGEHHDPHSSDDDY